MCTPPGRWLPFSLPSSRLVNKFMAYNLVGVVTQKGQPFSQSIQHRQRSCRRKTAPVGVSLIIFAMLNDFFDFVIMHEIKFGVVAADNFDCDFTFVFRGCNAFKAYGALP